MTDATLEHDEHGLSGRGLAGALFVKYVTLFAYGVWAAVVEIPTFVLLGGSTFAVAWASTVAIFAGLAAIGIVRTWTSGRYRLEKWATAFFVLAFSAYSSALVLRSSASGDWEAAPLALIPLALCALPTIRYYSLVRRGHFRWERRRLKP